jgi:hypothetical protein
VVAHAPDPAVIADEHGAEVGFASWDEPTTGVFRVVVTVSKPANLWEVEITNKNEQERLFLWTVANTLEEAHQSWVDVAPVYEMGGITFQEGGRGTGVSVMNRGSGPLTIVDAELWSGAPFFEVMDWSATINAQETGEVVLSLDPSAEITPSDGVFDAEIRLWTDATNRSTSGFTSFVVRSHLIGPVVDLTPPAT